MTDILEAERPTADEVHTFLHQLILRWRADVDQVEAAHRRHGGRDVEGPNRLFAEYRTIRSIHERRHPECERYRDG